MYYVYKNCNGFFYIGRNFGQLTILLKGILWRKQCFCDGSICQQLRGHRPLALKPLAPMVSISVETFHMSYAMKAENTSLVKGSRKGFKEAELPEEPWFTLSRPCAQCVLVCPLIQFLVLDVHILGGGILLRVYSCSVLWSRKGSFDLCLMTEGW